MKNNRMLRWTLIVALLLVMTTALIVTSCTGGSSEGDTNPLDTTPMGEKHLKLTPVFFFWKKGNVICNIGNLQIASFLV